MQRYIVHVQRIETLVDTFEVEAENQEQAMEKAEADRYRRGDFSDHSEVVSTVYNAVLAEKQ